MTTLSKDEVMRLAREADTTQGIYSGNDYDEYLMRFATLCRADPVAENERLKSGESMLKWVELLAERDAFKADAAQLREALQDLYNDSIGFQDKSNWAMEKARAAIDMKQGEA